MSIGRNMWTNFGLLGPILLGILWLTMISLPGLPSEFGPMVCAAQTELKPLLKPAQKTDLPAAQATLRIPPVILSTDHRKQCRVHVGDTLPPIELSLLGGGPTKLTTLHGKQATIILFWHPHHWMTQNALSDFSVLTKQWANQQVTLVGIASEQPVGTIQAQLTAVGANFPQMVDTDGNTYSQISHKKAGTFALPRVFVLDAEGKIVWFDIEYSEASRRELRQAVGVLVKRP